jgi:hypothetical protein
MAIPENSPWKETGLEDIDFEGVYGDAEAIDWEALDDPWYQDVWNTIGGFEGLQNILDVGSGLYGLYESDKMKDMAKAAMGQQDPFGPYRKQSAEQLMALMADPSLITKDPGYDFQFNQGRQAVERTMSAQGFTGSGNESIALTQYGQDYAKSAYNDKIAFLAKLAGADIAPNLSGPLAAYGTGIDQASRSLASIGYGLGRAGDHPGAPKTPGRPNSAGGEAAKIIGGLGVAGSVADLAGFEQTGDALSGAASTAGNLYGIYTGIDEGGFEGYSQAAGNAASLAGYSKPPVVTAIEAGKKLVEGDAPGAAMGVVSAAVPLAGLGFAAADLLNKSFVGHGDERRNAAAWGHYFPGSGTQVLGLGRAGMQYGVMPDGSLVDPRYMESLMGAWYGANASPDGNTDYWKSEYDKLLANPVGLKHIPKGYTWDQQSRTFKRG